MIRIFISILLTACYFGSSYAQIAPPDTIGRDWYYISLKNKNQYIGVILEKKRGKILFETASIGTIRLLKKTIKYMEPYRPDGFIDGVYWPENRFDNRYALTPSAKLGETYYQNTLMVVHNFNFRYSEEISLGVGFFPVDIEDALGYYAWMSPQVALPVKSENFHLSVGYYGATSRTEGGREWKNMGLVYGVGTYGNDFLNGSIGIGYGMIDQSFMKRPMYTVNMAVRLDKFSFLNLEFMSDGLRGSFLTLSHRTQLRRNTFDYGFVTPVNRQAYYIEALSGPFLTILIPFGRNR